MSLYIILSWAFCWKPNVDHLTNPKINISKESYNFVEVSEIKTIGVIGTDVSRLGADMEKDFGATEFDPRKSEMYARRWQRLTEEAGWMTLSPSEWARRWARIFYVIITIESLDDLQWACKWAILSLGYRREINQERALKERLLTLSSLMEAYNFWEK